MAFPIQIDTTQLTYGTFRIPNVTEDALDGKTVPTLQLESGSYSLFVDAAGQTATFSITPQGTVDYHERYDRFLTGKGTTKLGIIGFEVTLDARSLKSFGIFFAGLPPTLRERFTLKTLRLVPGSYRIQQRGGTVATFSFSLELDGTFNYDAAHDTSNGGFLSGKGTATLELIGYTIQIDTTQLSYPHYLISGITPTPLEGKTIQTLQLLPDAYNFQNDSNFSFNVTPQGQIDFDPALSNFLTGQASKTLTISGFPVTLDGQRFPRGILLIAISAFIQRETLRLVPGLHRVQQTGGAVANFTFKLERDGTFSYDPAFDTTSGGFLTGRGTSTLEFVGYSVLVDAREYQGTSVVVHGITVPNATPELQPIPLLPHTEIGLTLNTNPQAIAKFAVEQNGTITLKGTYTFLELQKQDNQTILKLKQPEQIFTVLGNVQYQNLQPFVGGTIRALDINAGSEQVLGESATDPNGHYTIDYSSEQLRPVQKTKADLQIVAIDQQGQELARSEIRSEAKPEETINLTINPQAPDALLIKGLISQENGIPLVSAIVRAFDKDLPSLQPNEEFLGETTTDPQGLYLITYTLSQLLRAEKNSADLTIRVFNPEGTLLAASPIYFNAPPEATIDVVVSLPEQQLSELEILLAELSSVLENIKPATLTDEDIAFLVGDTGIEQERLELLRTADQLAQETNLPTAVFYGFGRQTLLLNLQELLDLDSVTLRQALEAAIATNIIPATIQDSLNDILARLDQLRDEQLIPVAKQALLQLLNQETNLPLNNYTVQPQQLDAGPNTVALTPVTSDSQGLVMIAYTVLRHRSQLNDAEAPQRLRLVILNSENQEIHQVEVTVNLNQLEPTQVLVPLPTLPTPPTHVLSELSSTLQHDLPASLLNALADQGIRTLEDIRRAGGLSQVQGLPVPSTDPSVRWLESHANLTLVSPDVQVNEALIQQDYSTVAAIARTPRSDFVDTMQEPLGEARATQMHGVAQAQIGYLNNLLTTARVEQANGYQAPTDAPNLLARDVLEKPTNFGCEDCLSAVSPLAYLADLLDYAVDHLRHDNKKIDLNWLTTTFHQPFAQLPATCNAVSDRVRQVRLAVEVLQEYLKSSSFISDDQIKKFLVAQREYLLATYTELLSQIGTSFEELRLNRVSKNITPALAQSIQALAERLGIAPDKLSVLLLTGVVVTSFSTITPISIESFERDLKTLFAALQTPKGIILSGVPQPELVIGQLIEEAIEILFGLESTHTRNLSGERPEPKLQQWRQEYLRSLWFEQDHSSDPYLEEPTSNGDTADLLPVIDPDVVGPDDLRIPLDTEGQPVFDSSPAFTLWQQRRQQVDQQLTNLRTTREAAEQQDQDPFAAIWQATYANAIPNLNPLLTALTEGTPAEKEQAKERIQSFKLSIESFTRFATLRLKDQLARQRPPQGEPLTAEEWTEIDSILTQVWKLGQFPNWRAQERERAIVLGGELFWLSLSEPVDGNWPLVLSTQHPLIDPEIIKLEELPDPTAGAAAHRLWQVRQIELQQIRRDLQETYQTSGFDALLQQAFGQVPAFTQLQNDLQSSNPQVVENAKTIITTELRLTVEGFLRLMTIKAKLSPTSAELAEVYSLLTTATKEKSRYSIWLTEEQQQRINADRYWLARKAKLPRWRASAEERQQWRQSLMTRQQPPLIDPDLINGGYFAKPKAQNPAYQLRRTRRAWVETKLQDLKRSRTLAGKNFLPWFDATLASILGISGNTLLALQTERDSGRFINARLEQLTLSPNAFETLLQVRTILEGGAGLFDAEWEDVDSILVQVEKCRRFSVWRTEERQQRIIRSADFFKLPELPSIQFSSPKPELLPEWRTSWLDLRDWEDQLQSRIDQYETIAQALQESMGATEEATLPDLRDALVIATFPNNTLEAQATRLTERLLIDLKNSGEQSTTRVSQAIESIQGLLWAVRTAQFNDSPNLTLNANDFDEEWQWLGSYATWRAAMFVFLYPENFLAPSLHRWKTPAFKALLESSNRLTPKEAERQAGDYASYLWDISAPSRNQDVLGAACHAKTTVLTTPSGEDLPKPSDRLLYFLFALSSGDIYWSAYDRREDSDYKQYPWMKVPGLDNFYVIEIVAAIPNYFSGYIYLFVRTIDFQLRYVRFDLMQPGKILQDRWERQVRILALPPEVIDDSIRVVNNLDDRPTNGIQSPRQVRLMFKKYGHSKLVFTRSLNLEGTGWDLDSQERSDTLGDNTPEVLAVLEISGERFVITKDSEGMRLKRYRFGSYNTFDIENALRYTLTWIGAEYNISGSTKRIHIFYRNNTTKDVRQRIFDISANNLVGPIYTSQNDSLEQIVPSYGYARSFEKRVLWQHSFRVNNSVYFSYRHGSHTIAYDQLIFPYGPTIAPWTPLKTLTSDVSNPQKYREDIQDIVIGNILSKTQYFTHEAYFLVPIYIAQQLQANGQYTEALDWFRLVYDYSAPAWNRKVYYGLVSEENIPVDYQRQLDWLLDPLDPHAIAATRRNTYTRYTLQTLIRCLLDYADDEFARDTAESVPRARTLYMTALELLDSYELKQNLSGSSKIIGLLKPDLSNAPELQADWNDILTDLYRISDRAILKETVTQVSKILKLDSETMEERLVKTQDIVMSALTKSSTPASPPNMAKVLSDQSENRNQAYSALLAQPSVYAAATQVGANTEEITTQIIERRYGGISYLTFGFCIPHNPVVESLRLRAELNLFKLRTNRNVAGIERQLQPYAVAINNESGLPIIGTDGQLALPGALILNPTPYRYPVLIERTKQLIQLAATTEAAMLSAIEKRDAELYNILKARQDIRFAQANVQLQNLRVTEAETGVSLAELQRDRARFQETHYQTLYNTGQTEHEKQVLDYLNDAVDYYSAVAGWAKVSTITEGIAGAFSGAQQGAQQGAFAGPVGMAVGALLGGFFGGARGAAPGLGAKNSARAAQASTRSQIVATEASYERRAEEWLFQQSLAQHDVLIGDKQIALAKDRTQIVGQERMIAEIQTQHAEDILNFLNTKFTNAELYDWMSDVLEKVYRFFLQQATAMARLAANQLAFERQETPTSFIQTDYWESLTAGQANNAGSNGQTPDRRGLTGSARLLQDIYQLDQYAFETDKRKLQLIKIISLARLGPYAFQRFRESGVFPFATPMELFDRDFPGHYLRLIKRVRTSVIALIPPTDGIHATLSTTGLSRVAVGSDTFQTVIVKRDPETVALSSPLNASGLFELDFQSDMLFPFESMGVDTFWEFRLPKAANHIDYRTIADVLITIEYTALNSFSYRQQVIQTLKPIVSADRPFSFRSEFADQWYDLHNPDQTATPLTITFKLLREDFPPNLDGIRIEHIVMYFARSNSAEFNEVQVSGFYFTEDGSVSKVGGAASSINGVISTRRGNASSWISMIGKSPFGKWEMSLPDNAQMREIFEKEQLEDILFVITYKGRTPEWPVF